MPALRLLLGLLLLGSGAVPALAQFRFDEDDVELLHDLRGRWQFHLGDDKRWADPAYDDGSWESIFVPAAWEDEGFPGYDGYAWYRTTFPTTDAMRTRPRYLMLGRIDDVDEVYVNGYLVGNEGSFPPHYETAYHRTRFYFIPAEFLNPNGENVIAVRVLDETLAGGIVEGRIGVYSRLDVPPMLVDLSGHWLFRTGDNLAWRAPDVDKRGWEPIRVPAKWEIHFSQGYNGFGWYRKTFWLPAEAQGLQLNLWLGRIDDLDEAFVNGVFIDGTGDMQNLEIDGDEWMADRIYRLPPEALRYGGYNTLAVRVYDGLVDGGIYAGPVGIARADAWFDSNPGYRPRRSWLQRLRDWWFRD